MTLPETHLHYRATTRPCEVPPEVPPWGWTAPWGNFASLVTTYVNASGALGPCLAHPRPLLVGAAMTAATAVCGASFLLGHAAGTTLRLDRGGR
ncbi:hypothetical protein [Streptomyces sp. NPDC048411]|uniref:hypothetical protein n=1 Tax=Streptomyces sp. NPDC048411 TaxID=3157206 RepID=UPI0034515CC1